LNHSQAIEKPALRVVRDRTTTLPTPLTSFIGREKVLGDVTGAVRASRLVTLIGAGGCGKTRLAIEATRSVEAEFADGVYWVELAAVSDASLVPQTLATALGIRHQPNRPPGESVAEYLSARRCLIVLDNCEHVIDAAAEISVTLLREAPGVHILATSRERLTVPGERAWPVPPLGLPSKRAREVQTLLDAEAVRLFLDRASAVLPAFELDLPTATAIAEICIRVDGIPLAIELAAARMNVLTPRQIADRLADAMGLLTSGGRMLPKRQRTLRAAIDWSYRLLTEQERTLFRRLSVFAGSFSLDAAEAVCSDAVLPESEVLDLLSSLVDKSLVLVTERDGEGRYRMLDTVDQYATELLEGEDDAATSLLRHAEHYARIVDLYAPRLRTAGRPRVMPVLDAEHDNIRAALDWSRVTPGMAELHHRMVSQLWWYWLHRVLWDEGLQRLSAAIALGERDVDPAIYSETLYGGGVVAWVGGVFLQSRVWLERCVGMRRELGAPGPLGMAMCALAQPTADLGQREEALMLVRDGVLLARDGCTSWDLAIILTTAFGYVHHASGLWDTAEQAYLEADALWSDPADDWGRSLTRNSLAVISWRRGDIERAEAWARDALGLLRDAGDRWFASRTLQVLGYMNGQRGEFVLGTKLLAASEAMRGEVGARLMAFEAPEWNRAVEQLRSQLGDAAFAAAWREGASLDFEGATELALGECDGDTAGVDVLTRPTPPAPTRPRDELIGTWPPADCDLVIRAFGPLQVRREGRVLTNEDWTYAKPRELLFYLLMHEGGCTKEQIGLDLWPDASPARLRSSFHVTVHHLRRALGAPDWVAFHEGRYRFEATRPIAFDVEQFEKWIDEAAALRDTGTQGTARRVALLQAAVDLYRGDFLDDAGFGDWSLQPRDRLHRRFADAAVDLAAGYHARQRYDDAATTCRALLARDNLDERAHRLLMEVLADAGRPADALRHYNVLVALFREELGIGPSADTLALAQRIGHS
jgi:predicted ATPase/DNA-binding SARP family transcriptional activator